MKYVFLIFSLYFPFITSVNGQEVNTITTSKSVTSCFEFIDLYSKVVENFEDPTMADQNAFEKAAERIIGTVTGIEYATRYYIMDRRRGINESSILADVNKSCVVFPNSKLIDTVLNLPVVNAAIRGVYSNERCKQNCAGSFPPPVPNDADGGVVRPPRAY